MCVQSEHVEIQLDGHNLITLLKIESSFEFLPLQFVFEMVLHPLDELDRILSLTLLPQDSQMEHNEFFINFIIRFLHKFKHEQVSDIQNFGLEFQIKGYHVHGLYSPLSM